MHDAIKPDLTMFLHYETLEEDGKKVVAVSIQRGTERPYYIAKKGLRPEGVYVRQGYSSVPATDSAIRQMIKETDGDHFEEMRSLNQELTFEAAQKEFELRDIEFGSQQMQTLKMIDKEGIYSNLGLLLSDQCVHTIKVAVFQGKDQEVFKDRREFSGSLLQQMNEVYEFIDFRNQTHATINGLLRTDIRDYPEVAVREALLNLIVHRDYSFSASALISIYEDRIEFVSVGGLVPGMELEDIMVGLSVCRNQNLANVFYRLKLIEAYGTGMRKIIKAYKTQEAQPVIESKKNAFKIILPNINMESEEKKILSEQITLNKQLEEKTEKLQFDSGDFHCPFYAAVSFGGTFLYALRPGRHEWGGQVCSSRCRAPVWVRPLRKGYIKPGDERNRNNFFCGSVHSRVGRRNRNSGGSFYRVFRRLGR